MTGGERDRMILESVFNALRSYLTELGWFDAGRRHAPINMIQGYPDTGDETVANTLAVSMEDTWGSLQEMGSRLEEAEIDIAIDLFGESEALSIHLIGDVYEWVKSREVLPIYHWDDTVEPMFYVRIALDSVTSRKARPTNPWQRHWRVVEFQLEDLRANDFGGPVPDTSGGTDG